MTIHVCLPGVESGRGICASRTFKSTGGPLRQWRPRACISGTTSPPGACCAARPSSSETNLLHYQGVIEVIEKHNENLLGWDVSDYLDAAKYEQFSLAWTDLRVALVPEGRASLTLVSKVMMGVWGCVPSFDTYFVATFKSLAQTRGERGAWNRAGKDALGMLHEVDEQHADEIESVRDRYPVWDFASGGPSEQRMTRAKVLDIFGFHETWKR